MHPLVIVGSGLAGWNLVRELRKISPELPIQVITADGGEAYPKPQISAALAKGLEPDALIQQSAEQWSTALQVELKTQTRIVEIRPSSREIISQSGETIPYSQLVLASGARPIQVPIGGDGAQDILRVNNLDDYRKFRSALKGKKKVALLGSGLIGIEFAHDLGSAGYEVHVIAPDSHPLAAFLPPQIGQEVKGKLEALGVQFHLGQSARAVHRSAEGYDLELSSQDHLQADLVLAAIGLAPDLSLATAAGLQTGRGIQVDRSLRTSDPHIYALGDAVEIEAKVLPFVMPLMAATKVLAQVLTGTDSTLKLPAMPVVVKSPSWPIVVGPDYDRREGNWTVHQDADGSHSEKRDAQGKLLAFALTGAKTSLRATLIKEMEAVLA